MFHSYFNSDDIAGEVEAAAAGPINEHFVRAMHCANRITALI